MPRAREIEDLAELELMGVGVPTFFGESPDFDPSYPDAAYVIAPVPEHLLARLESQTQVVAVRKKDVTALKKLGFEISPVDAGPSAVLKNFGLSRQSMGISSLKKSSAQIQVARVLELLGESKEAFTWAMADFAESDGFAFQEAFLQCNLKLCLKMIEQLHVSDVVGQAALLLSGHTMAFMIKGASFKDVVAAGFNSFYANKIRDFSVNYVRRVDYDRATDLLTSVLPRIKEGQEGLHLLRRTVVGVLARS